MSRLLAPLLLCLVSAAAVGCDLTAFLVDTDALPGAREGAAEACCDCLVNSVAGNPEDRCVLDGVDAGPVNYDGGVTRSRCLCTDDTVEECAADLIENKPISLIGACASGAGVCGGACGAVLAYP